MPTRERVLKRSSERSRAPSESLAHLLRSLPFLQFVLHSYHSSFSLLFLVVPRCALVT